MNLNTNHFLIRVIKLWDLRKNYTSHRQDPIPMQTYPYPGSCMRMRLGELKVGRQSLFDNAVSSFKAKFGFAFVAGYSGLVLDSSRSNVMCNCTDDNIYMFNISGIKTSPGKQQQNRPITCWELAQLPFYTTRWGKKTSLDYKKSSIRDGCLQISGTISP